TLLPLVPVLPPVPVKGYCVTLWIVAVSMLMGVTASFAQARDLAEKTVPLNALIDSPVDLSESNLRTFYVDAPLAFSQVYVFGDSVSDTGNYTAIAGDLPPPYDGKRLSNGPMAVEVLARALGLNAAPSLHLLGPECGTNYSVASATASGNEAIDLAAQVASFNANHNFVAPSDALYTLILGGNDVRAARDAEDWETAIGIVSTAVERIHQTIETLSQEGARSFLVVNAPDIGGVPETRVLMDLSGDQTLAWRAHQLSQAYRIRLHYSMYDLRARSDVDIVEFDLFRYFNRLMSRAQYMGFRYLVWPCSTPCSGVIKGGSVGSCYSKRRPSSVR
ncbi:MAG: SGNH/GDSL hydrolase family protein, partial [Gammaproteobacteria bacterium]